MFCCSKLDDAEINRLNTYDQEHEANEFASELLMPQKALLEMIPERETHFRDISTVANAFNVSMTMCARKMVQMSKNGKEVLFYYNGEKLLWYVTGNQVEQAINFKARFDKYSNMTEAVPDIEKWNAYSPNRVDTTAELFTPFAGQKMVLVPNYTMIS